MLQPRPILTEWALEFWTSVSTVRLDYPSMPVALPPPSYIAMHVRWGDKCYRVEKDSNGVERKVGTGREARCVEFDEYMKVLCISPLHLLLPLAALPHPPKVSFQASL